MFWFHFLGKVEAVVDESEAGRLAASELGAEPEGEDYIGRRLVHARDLLTHLCLGNGGAARM